MKFIKYKQVARITLYGFDDLNRNNNSSVFTEPLNSFRFSNNAIGGVLVGNNAKRMRFQIKGLDNVKLSENVRFCMESIHVPMLYDGDGDSASHSLIGLELRDALRSAANSPNHTETLWAGGQVCLLLRSPSNSPGAGPRECA